MPAKTITLPATVEIPTEIVVDVVSFLFAFEESLLEFNGRGECATTRRFRELAFRVISELAPTEDIRPLYAHPYAVEACARAEELLAEWYDELDSPAVRRGRAAHIRDRRHGLAHLMTDEEIEDEVTSKSVVPEASHAS